MAIEHALTILSWYENHVSEDIPDEYLWEDPDGLAEHWESVKEKKERKYGQQSGGSPAREAVPPAGEEMDANEYAAALRG